MGKLRGLAVALVAACGAPPPAQPPKAEPSLEVKTFAPLGMKGDAKAPNQAVILGTDDKNGSTILPLPVTQAKSSVDAMFVKMGSDITGGMSPVKLATAPNTDGAVQVG